MRRLAAAAVIFLGASTISGARATAPLDCHAFADPRGDAPSPAVDWVEASLQTVGEEVVGTITLDDLGAPHSIGSDGARYLFTWSDDPHDARESVLVAFWEQGAWRFEGADRLDGAPVTGSIDGDTIRMAVPSALVGGTIGKRVATLVTVLADDLVAGLPLAGDTKDEVIINRTHHIGIDTPCRVGDGMDSPTCPVVVDHEGDLEGTSLPPGEPERPRDLDLIAESLETTEGILTAEFRVRDLGEPAPEKPRRYGLSFWVDDATYRVQADRDAAGWRFGAEGPEGPITASGAADPAHDSIRVSVALDAMPGAAAGRALAGFQSSASTGVTGVGLLAEAIDYAPDDDAPGWFIAGGGCAADSFLPSPFSFREWDIQSGLA